jgi:lipid A ethanolaminephosphotransferase
MKRSLSHYQLILIASLSLIVFYNITFFKHVLEVYPLNLDNSLFLFSLAIVFFSFNIFVLALICFKKTIKPVLISILLISSLAAYFMDTYNVIIDDLMIDNIIKTDIHESLDLFSLKQVLYFVFLGVVPSIFIYRIKLKDASLKATLTTNLVLLISSLAVIALCIVSFSAFYASFFREHKPLRYYANPSYYIYSSIKYISELNQTTSSQLKEIGSDAAIPETDTERELVILVVGETARADHFSLNGYDRDTNPLLSKESVISFNNVWSCGTSTAHSVPCMFSIYEHDNYKKKKALNTENIVDVLQKSGVNVVWLDNNSSSKGVADRIEYHDYKSPKTNPVCDTECRDEGMLANLQSYIDSHPTGDILIILHQMGSHGPAYYKRYPEQFEKFTPVCQTNQLEQCSQQEIINTYDNTLLYTDYFLSQTIKLLKNNAENFESAMLYMSDHGESLGENSVYLHGLPYSIAPEAQRHVPFVMWFNDILSEDINLKDLRSKANSKLSQDNLFHTLLGLMEVETELYDQDLDIIEYLD